MMNAHLESPDSELVEFDPTGRYGRYNEVLGKGASKIVYRGFDEYDGIEVAWNQVKLHDFLQSPEDLERLYCEIHLLKTLNHQNIMKFYTSWVDPANRNINFVTEIFTSGNLRQYRKKHKRVNIRAVKHWCRQILRGLLYLHSHDPPVIHRDLKCDNIFVNGNHGEVKIGDLGLAAILRQSHAAHCVGTPEFMAPEVYAEEYNELIDIYSFGMCILEMVTFEYPYSECTHPAQIYKKVISGQKPDALYKVEDTEVRQFIEKCLATASLRLSARELLNDPFLLIDDCGPKLRPIECQSSIEYERELFGNDSFNGDSNGAAFDGQYRWDYHPNDIEQTGIEMFDYNDDEHDESSVHLDITIKGKMREDGRIFLRLRITDKEGHIRNIYFEFNIEMDTALSVATEMVGELDITDQDVTNIADMIDGEIASLVPEWRIGPGYEETPRFANSTCYHNCFSNHTSTGSLMNFLSTNNNSKVFPCCGNDCSANMHGRFEEITYRVDTPRKFTQTWDHQQHESLECSSVGSGESHSIDQERESTTTVQENRKSKLATMVKSPSDSFFQDVISSSSSAPTAGAGGGGNHEIQQEFRWIKAKYQMELRELRDEQGGVGVKSYQIPRSRRKFSKKVEKFTTDSFLPNGHHRRTSLPVDAVDL